MSTLLERAQQRLIALRALAADIPAAPYQPCEISEESEISPPCPRCRQPLDGFAACPECHIRQCPCGAVMDFYAIACPGCLGARFARLAAERQGEHQPVDQEPDPRLWACPTCALQGRRKLIPRVWERCAGCDGERPVVLPFDQWDDEAARALTGAALRRVSAAWGAIPAEQREPTLQAHLGGAALAPIEVARRARDMMGLRHALANYEAEARPLFEAARLTGKVPA